MKAKWIYLFIFIVLVIILISVYYYLIIITIDDWQKRAFFGDMFGAFNALFSGLAFCGVVYAIILQHQELNETRNELKRSANAQELNTKIAALSSLISFYEKRISDFSPDQRDIRQDAQNNLRELVELLNKEINKLKSF